MRQYVFTFTMILMLNFLLPRLMPGDPFVFLTTDEGAINASFTEQEIAMYKAYYGLDQPLHQQFISYVQQLLQADLGYSIYYKAPVLEIIGNRLPWTLSIVMLALLISTLLGVLIGSLSAWYRDTIYDRIIYPTMVTLSEIPAFLVGIAFLFIVAANFTFIPLAGGMSTFATYDNRWEQFVDLFRHALLPVTTLVFVRLGDFYLLARNSMIHVLGKDYIRTAQAKGLHKSRIVFVHALRNSILPIVTRVFLSFGAVFGGAILVENVFRYPGLGSLMQEAVLLRDYTLIQGIFMFIALTVLTMNLIADIIYKKLDPRIADNEN